MFKEGARHGKDAVFRSFGYAAGDSEALANSFAQQGAANFDAGNFMMGNLDQFGQRITIPIRLVGQGDAAGRATTVLSGWMITPEGTVRLVTPFAGFA